jgi:predicted RNA-binding protein with PIN domain
MFGPLGVVIMMCFDAMLSERTQEARDVLELSIYLNARADGADLDIYRICELIEADCDNFGVALRMVEGQLGPSRRNLRQANLRLVCSANDVATPSGAFRNDWTPPYFLFRYPSSAIMEEILDERFHRLETALNVLIESITTYNPSVSAAVDLIAADDNLSEGLDQRKSSASVCTLYCSLPLRSSGPAPSKSRAHPPITPHCERAR